MKDIMYFETNREPTPKEELLKSFDRWSKSEKEKFAQITLSTPLTSLAGIVSSSCLYRFRGATILTKAGINTVEDLLKELNWNPYDVKSYMPTIARYQGMGDKANYMRRFFEYIPVGNIPLAREINKRKQEVFKKAIKELEEQEKELNKREISQSLIKHVAQIIINEHWDNKK